MGELSLHNGSRLNGQVPQNAQVPAHVSHKQRVVATVEDNVALQTIMSAIIAPAETWIKSIVGTVGRGEAEISLKEKGKATIRRKK